MSGLLWTVVLIASCVFLGYASRRFLERKGVEDSACICRKIVHIGVCNWYFIYVHSGMDRYVALAGLAVSAIANATLLPQLLKQHSPGLVLYPVSIMAMIALSMLGFGSGFCLGCGLLVMGYGDGLAGLAGKLLGKRKLPGKKNARTYLGSATMFLISFIILLLMCLSYFEASVIVVLSCLATAAAATLAEAFTQGGFDNISVPLVVYCLMEVLSCRFF